MVYYLFKDATVRQKHKNYCNTKSKEYWSEYFKNIKRKTKKVKSLIMEILLLYYIFSVLFMIGYIDFSDTKILSIIGICFLTLIIAPIYFPINVGYYFYKNS